MKHTYPVSRNFLMCIVIGVGIMSFALLLNPMAPNDFLILAFSAPLETIREAYGIHSAASFWISVALISTGIIGLIGFGKR